MEKDKFVGKWVKPVDDSLEAQVGRSHPQDMERIACDIFKKMKIKREDKVLDVSCGNGLITKIIAKKCKEVYGVDFSEFLIATAKKESSAPNIHYIVEDALNIDKILPDAGLFDKAYCYYSLQHLNPKKARTLIEKLSKVTKPTRVVFIGGIPDKRKKRRCCDTWRKRIGYFLEALFVKALYRRIKGKEGKDSLGWWYHPNEIKKMCSELNLKCEILEQVKYLPHSHYRFDVLITKEDIGRYVKEDNEQNE